MSSPDDDKILAEAVKYSRIREQLALLAMVLNFAVLVVSLTSELSGRLREIVDRDPINKLGVAPPYAAAGIAAWSVLLFPLTFFRGYIVEHRFSLSNQSVREWFGEWAKGVALMVAIGTPIVSGVLYVVRRYPRRWWAILAALSVPFTIVVSTLTPVLILPLFNRFESLADREVAERVKGLAETAGVDVSNVLQMDMSRQTKKANAFFTGLGRSKRIVLADTLLHEFEPDEIEIVMAHELGHQVHRDVWKLIGLQLPLQLGVLYAIYRLGPGLVRRYGYRWRVNETGLADPAVLPLFGIIGSGMLVGAAPIVNALVRRFIEHRADVFAMRLTDNPQAFIRTMNKLGRMNLSNPKPSPLVKWLLYDHPTQSERIEYASTYKRS